MLAGVMPGGQAGPFASAQARSRALMLPTGARGVAVGGAIWSDWVCSTAWGSDFYGEYGGKYIRRTGRGGAHRICRVSADDGRLGRRPTGTGATSPAARAGCGWSP